MKEPAKITKLKDVRLRVQEKVLGFDVAMANTHGMDVRQGSGKLIHVEL